jgi:hypothetical protein
MTNYSQLQNFLYFSPLVGRDRQVFKNSPLKLRGERGVMKEALMNQSYPVITSSPILVIASLDLSGRGNPHAVKS